MARRCYSAPRVTVHFTGTSGRNESRTEQYFVTASSTARSACARSIPLPAIANFSVTCSRRRGIVSTRLLTTSTERDLAGVRRLARISTTSTDTQAASDASSPSTGLGPATPSPSRVMAGWPGFAAEKRCSPDHSIRIDAAPLLKPERLSRSALSLRCPTRSSFRRNCGLSRTRGGWSARTTCATTALRSGSRRSRHRSA